MSSSSTESFALLAGLFGLVLMAIVMLANTTFGPPPSQGLALLKTNQLLEGLKLYAAEMDFRSRVDESKLNEDVLHAALFDAFQRDYSEDPSVKEFRARELSQLRQRLMSSYERLQDPAALAWAIQNNSRGPVSSTTTSAPKTTSLAGYFW